MKKYLYSLLLILLFSGCSISGTHYLRNLQNHSAKVVLFFEDPLINRDQIEFLYTPEILEIKKNSHRRMKDSLIGTAISPNSIEILLPPHSTTLLGNGTNGRLYLVDSLIISTNQGSRTYNTDHSSYNFKGFFIGYTEHIDITE
jgi:hypothetical protein